MACAQYLICPLLCSGTTKGTGGDILILEEAAYVDCNFFYETVAPILLVGVTSLICISTLTSDIKYCPPSPVCARLTCMCSLQLLH